MTLIKTIVNQAKEANIRIEENCAAILITANKSFSTETITHRVTGGGSDGSQNLNLSINTNAKMLSEMAAKGEGFIQKFTATNKEHCFIQLTQGWAGLPLNKNRQLVIDLYELDNTKTYEIYAIPGNAVIDFARKTDRDSVLNGSPSKQMNLAGINRVFIKDSAALTGVTLNMGGHSGKLTREELKALQNKMNDIVSATPTIEDTDGEGSQVYKMNLGFENLLEIPFVGASTTLTIESTGASEVEFFSEKIVSINSFAN